MSLRKATATITNEQDLSNADVNSIKSALGIEETFTSAEKANLANQSGTNTGDQDISGIAANASDISTIQAEQITQDEAIALNTAKNSYPSADAAKLDGIEAGAEVNPTDAEIVTSVNNELGSTDWQSGGGGPTGAIGEIPVSNSTGNGFVYTNSFTRVDGVLSHKSNGSTSATNNVVLKNSSDNELLSVGDDGGVLIHGKGHISTNIGLGSVFNPSTTGGSNVGVGLDVMSVQTSASSNVAVGVSALFQNVSSSGNMAIGLQSLYSLQSGGGGNVGVGLQTLRLLTTGRWNIGIGQSAGSNCGTNERSVFIGFSTQPSANSGTNEVVIGAQTTGNGSNTVTIGNVNITNTYLKGTLNLADTPTSPTGLTAGDVWNDGGILKIV